MYNSAKIVTINSCLPINTFIKEKCTNSYFDLKADKTSVPNNVSKLFCYKMRLNSKIIKIVLRHCQKLNLKMRMRP